MTPVLAQRPRQDRQFERLYRKHVADVYRYSLAVLRNPADAEDVTQTTFLNAYRAFQRGERPQAPKNWLIAIAHNVCRQRFRQASRRPNEVELVDELAPAAAGAGAESESYSAEDIQRALGQLQFNQRSALVMRELEGRSYAEIAAILSLSVGAVETLIFRARRALREQLEGSLSCDEAELALSRAADGVLPRAEKGALRAHLRVCKECATAARRMRAQRGALKALGAAPLPGSLVGWVSSWLGGGAAAGGSAVAVKAAAVTAAGLLVAGGGIEGKQLVERHTVKVPRHVALAAAKPRPRPTPVRRVVASAPSVSAVHAVPAALVVETKKGEAQAAKQEKHHATAQESDHDGLRVAQREHKGNEDGNGFQGQTAERESKKQEARTGKREHERAHQATRPEGRPGNGEHAADGEGKASGHERDPSGHKGDSSGRERGSRDDSGGQGADSGDAQLQARGDDSPDGAGAEARRKPEN